MSHITLKLQDWFLMENLFIFKTIKVNFIEGYFYVIEKNNGNIIRITYIFEIYKE